MQLKEFLDRVLPSDGFKCWVEINKRKKVIQGFTATTEELALKLADIDARGSDAYFACAVYKTAENRQAANALMANAFWLDIDAGEGKPYADADAAIGACDEFCNRYDLPLPGIVRSGNGAHAYWIFDRPLSAEIWQAAASRLKLLVSASGFHADQSRTADIASILRPVSTRNFKCPDTPRPVEADSEDGWDPVDVTVFLESLLSIAVSPSQKPIETAIKTPCVNTSSSINSSLLAGIGRAFDATKGVEAGRRGSTQLKYAGELVAKGMPEPEIIEKCRAWNQLCTPPQEDGEVVRIVRSALNMHVRKHPPILPPEEVQALPKLPHGYRWGQQNQLEVEVEQLDASGAPVFKWKIVSRYPVYLAAILRHESGDQENSYLFKQFTIKQEWKEFAINSEGMNSTNWYAAWFKNGGTIQDGMDKHFKTYVRRAEDMLRDSNEVTRYNQFGWKENSNAFLVGDQLIRNGYPQRVYGTDKLTPLMATMAVPKEGSLEEWTAQADKFFSMGMEAHGFALLTSFAAPLISFCAGLGDGGAILSLTSEESGKGKTPITEAIASVWGEMGSTVMSASSTENSLMEAVVRHCHLPLVREEMSKGDPLVVAEGVKRFTAGVDRERLNRDGASKGGAERYQTILISVSNLSLYETVAAADIPASRRIFELDMKRPANNAFNNLGGITREMMRCRAFAGRRWAQILTMEGVPQYLREHLTGLSVESPGSAVMRYRQQLETSAEHRFIVWLLASVDMAARLLVHYGILHFDVDRIMKWAVDEALKAMCVDGTEDAPSKLQRFLGEFTHGALIVSDSYNAKHGAIIAHVEPKHKLVMRAELKTRKLYIEQQTMKSWCVRNRIPYSAFGRALLDEHIVLERSKLITLGAGTMIPSSRAYCWELDLSHPLMGGTLKDVTAEAAGAATKTA